MVFLWFMGINFNYLRMTKSQDPQYICMFQSRNKKCRNLPLVLGVPLDMDQGTMLVVGIPPLSLDDERKK